MTSASIILRDPSTKERVALKRAADLVSRRPLITALLVVVLLFFFRFRGGVDSDVTGQLWIAHQLNGGASLYRDIIEVNPPLWFWMARPLDLVATLLDVRAEHLLAPLVGLLAALSLAATDRLLISKTPLRRTAFLVYTALILLAMPWLELGQREQLLLIGAIPYALLAAARRSEVQVSPWLAFSVGIGAGVGFALKHYFILCPALLELWLFAAQRRRWRPFRPETLGMGAVGLAYGVAIMLWASDYLHSIVPMVRLAYGVTGASRLIDLFQPGVILSLVTMLLLVSQWRLLGERPYADAASLTVAATGFLVAYFVQRKGWPYHAQPMLGCASLGLLALVLCATKPPRLICLVAPALLLMPFAVEVQAAAKGQGSDPDVRRAILGLSPGEPVGFIGVDWSIGAERGLGYPSRYMSFWMLSAVARNEALGSHDPRLTELGASVVRNTIADYRCLPPHRIIWSTVPPGSGNFDLLAYFRRDPQFAELLSHYRLVRQRSVLVFDQVSPLSPPGRNCIRRARD
jgi:hypothetical protein